MSPTIEDGGPAFDLSQPFDKLAVEAGADREAQWDGRTFSALGRADKERYVNRFADGLRAYFLALDSAQRSKGRVGE